MAAFLPIAVLLPLLVTGATAGGYYGQSSSPSTPAPYTPTTPAPYTPHPHPAAPNKPPAPATARGYGYGNGNGNGNGNDDDKKLVVVRVEGMVLCQSCKKRGSQSLDGAEPLPKAKVTVTCRGKKNRVMAYRRVAADDNGYFHAEFGVQRADAYWAKDPRRACFVRLLASPDAECNGVTNINVGFEGAPVRDEGKQWTDYRGIRNVVYAAGPLAFRPGKCAPTHRY